MWKYTLKKMQVDRDSALTASIKYEIDIYLNVAPFNKPVACVRDVIWK